MLKSVAESASFLEQKVREFTDMAVLGISGGIDSSVVASICCASLGPENVYLLSMPYGKVDRETFNFRSEQLATSLGAHHFSVPIEASCKPIEQEIAKIFPKQKLDILTPANIRPRVRMNILYSISGELGYKLNKRVRVMGTGHLSEDIIGYDTKGGDALCDIFILSDLVKSEVYQLGKHYSVPDEIMNAAPSAGLYADQTDEEELGYNYTDLECATLALFSLLKTDIAIDEINPTLDIFNNCEQEHADFVVKRYKQHFHKHLAPTTVDFPRSEYCE